MVFPERAASAHDLSCIIWKDGIFSQKHDPFSLGRKWKTAFLRKYMETWSQPANIGPHDILGRSPSTSAGRPLKILFDRPGDVPIWCPGDVPKWRPRDVLEWRSGDVLIWRSRDVLGRLIRDVPRTSPREYLENTQTWMSKIFFNFSFRTYSIDEI